MLTADTLVGGVQPVTTLTNVFDPVGNRIQLLDSEGGTTTLAYDVDDNLVTITDPVGLVTTFAYSGGLLASVGNDLRIEPVGDRDGAICFDRDRILGMSSRGARSNPSCV